MELTGRYKTQSDKTWITSDPQKTGFLNRRKHERIYYGMDWPEDIVPELFFKCRGYRVLDLSASGIRFAITSMVLGSELKLSGIIRFPDNQIISFSGEVVRYHSDQIAIKLNKEIPNSIIMAELSRLRELEKQGVISAYFLSPVYFHS